MPAIADREAFDEHSAWSMRSFAASRPGVLRQEQQARLRSDHAGA